MKSSIVENPWRSFVWIILITLGIIVSLLIITRERLHLQVLEAESALLRNSFGKAMDNLFLREIDLGLSPSLDSLVVPFDTHNLLNLAALEILNFPQVQGVQAYDRNCRSLGLTTEVYPHECSEKLFLKAKKEGWAVDETEKESIRMLIHLPETKEGFFIEMQLVLKPYQESWTRIDQTLAAQGMILYLFAVALLGCVFKKMTGKIKNKEKLLWEKTELLQRANLELSQAYKTSGLGALTGHLMHSLRGYLHSLQNLVRDESEIPPEEKRHDLALITEKINDLVQNALHAIKDTEKGMITYSLSIREVFEVARDNFRKVSPQSMVLIDESPALSESVNNLQANLILAILSNLLRNSSEAKEKTTITLQCMGGDSDLSIDVWDDAGGISQDLKNRLFLPLRSNKKNGAGIGLALSKQLAESMGGDLRFIDSENSGCRFRLTLPSGG